MSAPIAWIGLLVLCIAVFRFNGCGDDGEASRRAVENRIRTEVARKLEERTRAERLRTWRIAGFCALGAAGIGCLALSPPLQRHFRGGFSRGGLSPPPGPSSKLPVRTPPGARVIQRDPNRRP